MRSLRILLSPKWLIAFHPNPRQPLESTALQRIWVAQQALIISGGAGTDSFYSPDPVDPKSLLFSRSELATTFSVAGEDGSILNATVLDDVEYLTFRDSEGINYYYLTEDLANNRVRSASFQEVYWRTYGNNADWLLNGLDTYSRYHVRSDVSTTLSYGQGTLTLLGVSAINGTGNSLDNAIAGNMAANILSGGLGFDTMVGGLGNDTYVVDNTGDWVEEEASTGADTVQSSVTYALGANVENLTLIGPRVINGIGNALGNILTGNAATNTLNGGFGNDTYVIGAGDTVVEALNAGTDRVQSSVAYTLGANVENLTLTGAGVINGTGNAISNILTGNAAANTLNGGFGNYTLIGGLGVDLLVGASGADAFLFLISNKAPQAFGSAPSSR
ncbi:MAG: calcium-binding protein [Cyanobium sp.]